MRRIRNYEAKNIAAFSAITLLLLSVAVTSQFASPSMVSAQIENKVNPSQTVTSQDANSCVKVPISAVSASGSDSNRKNNNDNKANAAIDNNPDTKWSDKGLGSYLQTDLGSSQPLCSVQISWDKGDKRSYNFVISISNDGSNFEDKYRGTSKGTDSQPESYDLSKVNARYVRITVYGNSDNNSAGINEIAITRENESSGEKDVNNNSCTKLGITGFKATPNDAGNVPANTIDNNLDTRWSSFGLGSFIQADLGSVKTICSVDIGWYNGDARQNRFVISVSKDGTTFSDVFSGTSSGQTKQVENYDFKDSDARYVRIKVNGNTQNNWASITEIAVFGFSPAVPPNHAPTVKDIPDAKVQITRPPAAPGSAVITLIGEDIDGDGLTFEVVKTPTNGSVSSTGPNTVKYTLNAGTQKGGTDSFTYKAVDSRGLSSTNVGTVTITISEPPQPPNNPPVVDNINNVPVQITTPPTPVSITLVGRDADGDQLTFTPNTQPTKGTVAVTGNIAKYTLNSNIQAATTDSFTYTANDGKAGGVSNIGTVTLQIIGQSQNSGIDKFGIKQLYTTKSGGEEWYMNMLDPTNDARFFSEGGVALTKNPNDASYKVKSSQVRLYVYTSSGYHPDLITTYDQKQLASKGYMQSPNDWKNVEITGYFKVNHYTTSTVNGVAHITLHARGGTHDSRVSCEGTAYHSNTYQTGESEFLKELEHTQGYATGNPDKVGATSKLDGRWVGLKAIYYTKPDNTVKLEQWIDDGSDNINTPGNNWHKLLEFTDIGNWGGGTPNCGGTPSTIITWGGPIVDFRWDNIDDMDFKNASVREIQPPSS